MVNSYNNVGKNSNCNNCVSYNNVSKNNNGNNGSKNELYDIITTSSFALDDIKLYLDTHPCDTEALKCYEEYKKIRSVAWMEYTREYGPLSAYDVNVCNEWTWINSPWPWEGVC